MIAARLRRVKLWPSSARPSGLRRTGRRVKLRPAFAEARRDYGGMAIVSGTYVERRIAAPHTWHASEMFLYLLELA